MRLALAQQDADSLSSASCSEDEEEEPAGPWRREGFPVRLFQDEEEKFLADLRQFSDEEDVPVPVRSGLWRHSIEAGIQIGSSLLLGAFAWPWRCLLAGWGGSAEGNLAVARGA